jgi:hypothetical protein
VPIGAFGAKVKRHFPGSIADVAQRIARKFREMAFGVQGRSMLPSSDIHKQNQMLDINDG